MSWKKRQSAAGSGVLAAALLALGVVAGTGCQTIPQTDCFLGDYFTIEDGEPVMSEAYAEAYWKAFNPDSLGFPRTNAYVWARLSILEDFCITAAAD